MAYAAAQDLSKVVKALARLALEQETSIKVLRQHVNHLPAAWSHELPLTPVPGGTTVEADSAKGSRDRPLRSVLIMCCTSSWATCRSHYSPRPKGNNWLKDGKWQYQTWNPSLGALIADERDPLSNQDVVEMLSRVIPLLGTPFMVNRFHANGGLKETNYKVVAFELEIFNRTPGCQDVWQVLEKLRGLSALQLIGIQLKPDAVQKLSLGFAN